jgi:hypothetical protein
VTASPLLYYLLWDVDAQETQTLMHLPTNANALMATFPITQLPSVVFMLAQETKYLSITLAPAHLALSSSTITVPLVQLEQNTT